MRVTLDSVVLVSAFISKRGLAAELLIRCVESDGIEVCLSQEILTETRETLTTKHRLRSRFAYIDEFLEALALAVSMIRPQSDVPVLERDPNDTVILATALGANANYLVTRDADLLDMNPQGTTTVISPEAFIHILRREEDHRPLEN